MIHRFRFLLAAFFLAACSSILSAEEPQRSPREAMELLATKAVQQSVKIVGKAGGIYPYAMLLDSTDGVTLIGYQGKENTKPPADVFAGELLETSQKAVRDNPEVVAAAIVRPVFIDTDDNKRVPGIWVLVDHREGHAWVVLQPLLPSGDGKEYRLGKMLTQATEQSIFPPVER